jgi:hypothetical protein
MVNVLRCLANEEQLMSLKFGTPTEAGATKPGATEPGMTPLRMRPSQERPSQEWLGPERVYR